MKFIDKYKEEHQGGIIGDITCIKCPSDFGYEPEKPCHYDFRICKGCWDREMPESNPEPDNANPFPGFEINDIVQLRSGRFFIVLPNSHSGTKKSLYSTYKVESDDGSGLSCEIHCHYYNGSIHINKYRQHNNVVKLWRCDEDNGATLLGYFFNHNEIPSWIEPTWVAPTKKMTLKEIEKEIGYPVEIIPESERKEDEE